jgi:effector-binding domain-containing protein
LITSRFVDNTYTIFLDKVFDDNEINIEVCIPINIEVKETDIVHFRKVDKFTAVYTEHKGSYDTIQLAYKTIYQWIQEHGYFPSMYSREVYIISPDNSDSPKEYLTEVAFPIE